MEGAVATAGVIDAVQVHATTVVGHEQGLSLTLTAIPRDAFPERPPDSLLDVAVGLGAELLVELPSPVASFLPHAIACILLDADADAGKARDRLDTMLSTPPREGLPDIDPGVLAFAEYCAFTPIVPMEESPLTAKVMARIVGVSGAVGLAALGSVPLLIAVASAAGTVVVLSAAVGVGERVYSWVAPASEKS